MSKVASTELLLQESLPHTAGSGGKARVLVALVVGFGFGTLLGGGSLLVTRTAEQPAINMAWQSMQRMASQSVSPMKVPAMKTQKAFAPSGLESNARVMGSLSPHKGLDTGVSVKALPASALTTDFGHGISLPGAGKCVYAGKHASLCGNLVVLRPETALRASKESSTTSADDIVKGLTDKLESIENKPQAALVAGGAVLALYFTNSIVSSVEAIPLIPKLFELVGIGYTGWFAYRYLLTKNSRMELTNDIEELKKKISGE